MEWKLEGGLETPDMEAEVGQVGRAMETPGWRQNYTGSFASWWSKSHTYKVSLVMEEVLELMEENDTLVVELTAETWGGVVSAGRGGPARSHIISKRHILHEEEQTWQEAKQASFNMKRWIHILPPSVSNVLPSYRPTCLPT